MNVHDVSEESYKNGYESGYIDGYRKWIFDVWKDANIDMPEEHFDFRHSSSESDIVIVWCASKEGKEYITLSYTSDGVWNCDDTVKYWVSTMEYISPCEVQN